MKSEALHPRARAALATLLISGCLPLARADAVIDWNLKANELLAEAKLGTPPAIRVLAMVQTAVADATAQAAGKASVEAAVAAANHATLAKLLPGQQASVLAAYQSAIARIASGPARDAGIAIGEHAAAAVLGARLDDGASAVQAYRPLASAGSYVPTAMPVIPHWSMRKPWLMADAAQFRPGPPPALGSEDWARDFNEVKDMGSKLSTRRSAEQTEIARFWEFSMPAIYYGVLRSVAQQPGRDASRNARLYAAAAQAMDDAMIGVFEAKYHYHFWRPVTAIRNGDIDGNDATERDPGWTALIDVPLHPEYPSAHSILAAAVGTVLRAEVGAARMPLLSTSSPTAKGATRQWTQVDAFVREVSDARVFGGIHFRAATRAGEAMGKGIGELAVRKFMQPPGNMGDSAAASRLQDRSIASGFASPSGGNRGQNTVHH